MVKRSCIICSQQRLGAEGLFQVEELLVPGLIGNKSLDKHTAVHVVMRFDQSFNTNSISMYMWVTYVCVYVCT